MNIILYPLNNYISLIFWPLFHILVFLKLSCVLKLILLYKYNGQHFLFLIFIENTMVIEHILNLKKYSKKNSILGIILINALENI